jgi:hypothetical protein
VKPANADRASLVADQCANAGAQALTCLKKELRFATAEMETAETRLFNCGYLRKLEAKSEAAAVEQLISARFEQLKQRADAELETETRAAGSASALELKTIELRSHFKYTDSIQKLNKSVCDAAAFTSLLSK